MKLTFIYDKERDIWCLLNKGKSSNNSALPTEVYKKLVASVGNNPDIQATSTFIDKYINENKFDIPQFIQDCQLDYNSISEKYKTIAEKVFDKTLNKEITAYITVNNRCPYSIEDNWFFVSLSKKAPRLTVMHELWHFYTWYKFGIVWEEKIGKEKYNNIKEALTVILNVECKDLLPENSIDKGYPQHQELRNKVVELWNEKPDINYVWDKALDFIS